MSKKLFAAVLAAALLAAPLPALMHNAQAETAPAKPDTKATEATKATKGTKAKKAKGTKAKKAKTKKPPTADQLAAHKRAKECGAEWRAAKKAGKIEKDMTWPKYWSACNKRLRAAGK
jgi:Ni/Co efflux regulator RcnB